jgi:hypothetical protein
MGFEKLSKTQLERHIRATAADTACVFLTIHVRAQMKKRHVITSEVFEAMRKGRLMLTPEPDLKTGHLICRMERYIAGRDVAVCVALDDNNPDLVVVTVIA